MVSYFNTAAAKILWNWMLNPYLPLTLRLASVGHSGPWLSLTEEQAADVSRLTLSSVGFNCVRISQSLRGLTSAASG
jgi:hypothetical protein